MLRSLSHCCYLFSGSNFGLLLYEDDMLSICQIFRSGERNFRSSFKTGPHHRLMCKFHGDWLRDDLRSIVLCKNIS